MLFSCLPDNSRVPFFFYLMQAKIRTLETQLSETVKAQPRSIPVSEPESADLSNSKLTGDVIDSSAVTRKLEEELKKRDALIEVCYGWQLCLIVSLLFGFSYYYMVIAFNLNQNFHKKYYWP